MSRTPPRIPKLTLLVGYLGLIFALAVAHLNPATGYELSVYGATPTAVWVGLTVALLAGAAVSLAGDDRLHREDSPVHRAALTLVGSVALSVVTMPILRGYTFYGAGDALSHVGWAREIATGSLTPMNLLYPGIHTATAVVSKAAAVPLSLANLYIVLVAFPLVFLLFVPAATRLLTDAPRAGAVGLLAGAAFVPVNNIAVHTSAHPASQTILLFAFVLYLALAHVTSGLDRRSTVPSSKALTTATGPMLVLAAPALVLTHPQQALNVAIFLCGAAGLQFLIARYRSGHPLADTPLLLPPTVLLIAAFGVWAPRFERVRDAVLFTFQSLLASGSTGVEVVGAKSSSLTTLGGSLLEVFLKLFGGATLLSVVAAVALLAGLWRHRKSPLAPLLVAGLIPVTGLFLVVLAANLGDMYFRYQGFLMVPIAVAGAAGIADVRDRFSGSDWSGVGTVLTVVVLVSLAASGLAVVHSSPYIYQPSPHVSDQQIEGYGAAFEHREPGVPFTGLRGGPRRYVDFHYGTEYARNRLDFPGYRQGIRPGVFAAANYSTAFEESRYVVITDATYAKEVVLYEGFRYPARGFRALETTPGVDRIRANGDFRLYRVDGGEES